MSLELVHTPNVPSEDIFFGKRPEISDWDFFVYANVDALKVDDLIQEFHKLEPLEKQDYRDLAAWRLHQKIRIALRRDKKKPYLLDELCETCASHRKDAVLSTCLWCAEKSEQTGHSGSRGNCEFLRPKFDHRSRSWGLLYYNSHGGDRDDAYMFWVAVGYKNREAGELALYPFSVYERWLGCKYKGLYWESRLWDRFIELEELMKLTLPMNPDEFEQLIRVKIREDMKEDHSLLRYEVSHAMDKIHRRDKDDDIGDDE